MNEYDEILLEDDARRRANLNAAFDTDPNRFAAAKRLADTTGAPATVVERNLPEVERRVRLDEYDRILQGSPELRRRLLDPDFARLASDDVGRMGLVERVSRQFVGSAAENVGRSLHGFGELANVTQRRAIDAFAAAFLPTPRAGGAATPESLAGPMVAQDVRVVGKQTMDYYRQNVTLPGDQQTFADQVIGGLGQVASQIVMLPIDRGASLWAQGASIVSEKVADDNAPQWKKDLAILGGSAVTGITERYALDKLLGPLPDMVKNRLGAAIGRIAVGGAAEGGQEIAENIGHDALRILLTNPEAEAKVDAGQAMQEGAVGFTVGAIVRAVVEAALHIKHRGSRTPATPQERAMQTREEIGAMVDAVAQTATLERDPAAVRQLITDSTQAADVFVDARALANAFAQSGIDLAQAMPTAAAQIQEAADAGADVVVPIDEFAVAVAQNAALRPLLDQVRTDPHDPTPAEARTWQEQQGAAFQAEAQQAMQQTQPDTTEGAKAVYENVLGQLQGAGRFSPAVNKQYAALMQTVFANLAQRTGIDVNALAAQYAPTIVARTLDGRVLAQEGDSPDQANISAENPAEQKDTNPHSFNPEGPAELRVFNQPQRGAFDPASRTIALLEGADLTTFFHESAHFYLEVLADISAQENAPAQVQGDMQKLLDWFGVQDLASWKALDLEGKRPHHEQFARGFEAYLFEGKSPSLEMQSLFQRFRAWMVRVYQTLGALDVQLTDEVRAVFDRLVATDEQIQRAQDIRATRPLYRTKPDSMSEMEWLAYQQMGEQAQTTALADYQAKRLKDIAHRRSIEGKQSFREIRKQVASEVMARPVYAARTYLSTGVLPDGTKAGDPVKLSLPILKQIYGEGEGALWRSLSFGQYGTASQVGVHPDIIAEQFGFASGDALVRAIVEAPKADGVIKAETAQRFAEQYGDAFTEGAIRAAAEQALANESHDEQLVAELNTLRRATGQGSVLYKAAKDFATQAIGAMPVRAAKNPQRHHAAEARASRLAEQAFATGDLATAASAKRDQVLNRMLARRSEAARDEIEKAIERTRKMFNTDSTLAKSRDMDLVNAARAVLAAHGLGVSNNKTAGEYVAQIKKNDPDTYAEIEPLIQDALISSKDYRAMRMDEFRALIDSVESLWHLSRRTKQIEIDGQLLDRSEVAAQLSLIIQTRGQKYVDLGHHKAPDKAQQRMFSLMGIRAALRRVESWVTQVDGKHSDGFRKFMWNPISEGVNAYRDAKASHLQKYLDLVKQIEPGLVPGKIEAPEIGYQFRDKAELLHAVLHTGNESNLRKLLLGRHWGNDKGDGTVDASRWQAFLRRAAREGIVTRADFDFAQSVWNLLDSMKPAAQQAHKNMYGFYFNEVTAQSFVDPFGVNRAGGYVPAVADPSVVTDAAVHRESEAIGQNNIGMFPTTGRGFTKTRVDYNKPLLLDLGYFPSHIDKVLRFTHIEPKVKDVARLVKHQGLGSALDAYDPTLRTDMLLPWLQRTAAQRVETPSIGRAGRAADTFFREVRKRTGLVIMTANVVNTLQQITGLSTAMVKVPPRYLMPALWQYVRQPSVTAEAINAKSSFMRNRTTAATMEIQQTIDDLLLNPTKYEKVRAFAQKHGYFMQAGFQNVVDTITWSGAFDQATEEGASERDAVRRADSAVRETQGSFAPEDMSRFESGTPFVRAFTMFYSYFNMQANLLGTEFATLARDLGLRQGAGRALYLYVFGFMIPAVLAEAIVRTMGQGWGDEVELWEVFSVFFGAQGRFALGMVPGVGPAVTAGLNTWNDKPYDDRLSTSPAISTIEATVRAPHSIYKAVAEDGKASRAIRDTLTAVSMLTGIPVAALGKPLGYAADVAQGRVDPTGPVDAVRGAVTGVASQDSKR